jgi:ketosteroid isomerase-like protein
MTVSEHERILRGFSQVISTHDWDRLGEFMHDNVVVEYPQSGERFEGLANVRGQFENYPDLGPGTSELNDIIGDTAFALTPSYTLIAVDGSGGRGTAVIRVRYPDGSLWWVLNLYQLRDGRIGRSRSYFAPDFDAPDWRAPYRAAP